MKKTNKNLQYSPAPRRPRLDETRYGPVVQLCLGVAVVAGVALLTIFLLVPRLTGWFSGLRGNRDTGTENSSATGTPISEPAIWTNPVETLPLSGVVITDPWEYDGKLLFAAGDSLGNCKELLRLDPATGDQESISVELAYDTLRYPVEDGERIVYVDAKAAGGGAIRVLDKASGKTSRLCDIADGVPRLFYEAPYVVFTARTGEKEAKLFLADVTTGDSVSLAVFADSPYAYSAPDLKSGQVLYANVNPEKEASGLIRTVLLADGTRFDYDPGSYVHDPKSNGGAWAYLSGNHGEDSDLYLVENAGTPRMIARGVVDFGISENCLLFSREETVYAYVFSVDRIYAVSEPGTNAQLLLSGDTIALWRDMTDPEKPLYKYMRLV